MNDPKQAIIKDFRLCLGTWIILELTCFALMPFIGASIPDSGIYVFGDVAQWALPSIVFGLFGSLIIALSTGAVIEAQNLDNKQQRATRFWGARILSLVGFLGVAFPLALTVFNFINALTTGSYSPSP